MPSNPLVCIFDPITTLIDQIPSASVYTGASAAGSPVVLNSLGRIDPSLLGVGTTATAGELLVAGALVNLYNNGGSLYMQNAYAAATGTAPSGAPYPVPAVAFVSTNVSINNSALVLFSGTFTYGDPNSEFSAANIGAEVYLRATTPAGGVTRTRPSGTGQLQQQVGTVVGFTAPNFVQIAFNTQPEPAFNNFSNIITGTNTTATMTVGSGSTLTFTGSGVVNANTVYGVTISNVAPTTGQVLIATGPTGASWQTLSAAPTTFTNITTGSNNSATMTVNTGASIVVTGTGSVQATQIQAVVISGTPPTNGQVLTATSGATANWQTPSAGSGTVTSVSGAGIATGTVTTSGSITVLGSGSTTTAATAATNLAAAPSGDVLTSDGSGNVQDSGTLLSSLAPKASPTFTGTASFVNITVSGTTSFGAGSIAIAALAADSISLTDSTGLFTITGSPATLGGGLTLSAFASQAQGAFLGGPASGSGAAAFRVIALTDLPSGYNAWSALASATGALVLANGTNTTTFNQTSPAAWLWANTTAATSSTSGSSSPILQLQGQAFVSSASVNSTYSIQDVISGTNAAQSTLTFSHTGTDTSLGYSFSGGAVACGSITSTGQIVASVSSIIGWNGAAAMSQSSGSISMYTTSSKTAYAPITVAGTTLGLVSYTATLANSPILTIAGSYEATSGPTFAEDSWTVQNIVGSGVNGTSTLTVSHSGTTGLVSVSIPTVATTGIATSITTKTSTYTAQPTDHTINCNGTFTLGLPTTGILVGQEFYIKNIGTGTITVSSSVNIDGATSLTLVVQYASIIVQWDGSQWWIY